MNRLLFALVLGMIVASCTQHEELIDNDDLIKLIDDLPITETWYKISVDSNRNKLDTVEIKYLKLDSSGNQIYKEDIDLHDNIKYITKEYYRDLTGLFYQEITSGNGYMFQTYETFLKSKDEVEKAKMITVYEGEAPLNIDMKYEYYRRLSGKIKTLRITATTDTITSESIATYNDEEKLINELIFTDQNVKDTAEIGEYYHEGSILRKYIYRSFYGSKKENVQEYDHNENLIRETEKTHEFGEHKIKAYWIRLYSYNDQGELISSTERDTISGISKSYEHVCIK